MIHFDSTIVDTRWLPGGKERLILRAPPLLLPDRVLSIPRIRRDGKTFAFITDGGTIPRFFWRLVGHPFSDLFPIYVYHDYTWAFRGDVGLSFSDTNDMLHDGCRVLGSSSKRAWTIYTAVKRFGGGIWRDGERHAGDENYHYAEVAP